MDEPVEAPENWAKEVDAIIANGGGEEGHIDRDDLLETYVRLRAGEGDTRALELVRMIEGVHPIWYA